MCAARRLTTGWMNLDADLFSLGDPRAHKRGECCHVLRAGSGASTGTGAPRTGTPGTDGGSSRGEASRSGTPPSGGVVRAGHGQPRADEQGLKAGEAAMKRRRVVRKFSVNNLSRFSMYAATPVCSLQASALTADAMRLAVTESRPDSLMRDEFWTDNMAESFRKLRRSISGESYSS
eukprot:jgi/Tetstr1/439800/TSEL_028212.t1